MSQSIAIATAVRFEPAPTPGWFARLFRSLVDLTAGEPPAGCELDAFMPPLTTRSQRRFDQ